MTYTSLYGELHNDLVQVEIYYTNGDYFWGDCVHGVKEGLASVVLKNGDNLMGRWTQFVKTRGV